MSPEAIAIILMGGLVSLSGWLFKRALDGNTAAVTALQAKFDGLTASQVATEKIVAVMEVRLGGELAQLRARLDSLERKRTGNMRAVSE